MKVDCPKPTFEIRLGTRFFELISIFARKSVFPVEFWKTDWPIDSWKSGEFNLRGHIIQKIFENFCLRSLILNVEILLVRYFNIIRKWTREKSEDKSLFWGIFVVNGDVDIVNTKLARRYSNHNHFRMYKKCYKYKTH